MRARTDRLEKLEERQRRLRKEIDRERALRATQARKSDARRKILVGAMVLGLVERGEWQKERILEKLDAYLSREYDRALFDLPQRAAHTGASAPAAREPSPIDVPA
jgi:hypothetical protein